MKARTDGRCCIRMEIEPFPDGRRKQKCFYGATLAECERKKSAYIKECTAGVQTVPPYPVPAITVRDWVDRWLTAYCAGMHYSARNTTQINCAKINAAMGDQWLHEIRQYDVQRLAALSAHYHKSTVDKLKRTINSVFRRAVENHLLSLNPACCVAWRHSGEGTHRALSDADIHTITRLSGQHRAGIWAMLMLWAGLRRGELMGLRWEDIDMERQTIYVRRAAHFEANSAIVGATKTDTSIRSIPMLKPLLEALRGLYGPQRSAFVCCTADGRAMTETAWRRAWQSYLYHLSKVKVSQIRPHDLRHTYASILYDAGVDVLTAQRCLGHASPEITMKIYTHLSAQKQATSMDKADAYSARFLDTP